MDIETRIQRRQRRSGGHSLISDYESLSPVTHVDDPSGRGPFLERLLDHLDPVFEGELPPNAYVHGPLGAGKSAIVTALFTRLETVPGGSRSVIHTRTRVASPSGPGFAYVDMRTTDTEFAFYHCLLDALAEDPVPDHGISTDELRGRLADLLGGSRAGVVIALDHVGEPGVTATDDLRGMLSGLPENTSWLAIGRETPAEVPLTSDTGTSIALERYRRQTLVDLLMARASMGLTPQALDHELARRVADWAEGNAHDALGVLFVAADRASGADRTRLAASDIASAIEEVPSPSVSLGRVLALPENKQLVLRELLALSALERTSVTATTDAITAKQTVDLSASTVKRYLYEMAEVGIVERVRMPDPEGKGRPPSRIELRFPPTVFRRLYDLQQ